MDFPDFSSIAQSTGWIFLLLLLIWSAIGVILYWGFSTGTTSMRETTTVDLTQDDEPIREQR